MRQESILLRTIEPVYLIDEHDRPLPVAPRAFRFGHHIFDFLDPGKNRTEGNEFALRAPRDNPRQRRLAASGRPPEQHRPQLVPLDLGPQRFSRTEQFFLPDKFIKRLRTHAICQRTPLLRRLLRFDRAKKSHGRYASPFA